MSVEENKPKIDAGALIKDKLSAMAHQATQEDKDIVANIVATAKAGKRATALYTVTAAAAASLFLTENVHNRDWDYKWTQELSRQMTEGLWKENNATIGFYIDGIIADGQHRLAAAALAGFPLVDYVFVFGIQRDATKTIDSPKKRDGASHAKMDGIQDANAKQAVIKNYANYMARIGAPTKPARSAQEIAQAIEENNALLDACLRLARESMETVANPVFTKGNIFASAAYLLLKNGWPEDSVRQRLITLQDGAKEDPPGSPMFVAVDFLTAIHDKNKRAERLTAVRELGAIVYVVTQAEQGKQSLRRSDIKSQVLGRVLPNPQYRQQSMMAAD